MANIPEGTLRDWHNGETMKEADYELEREILRAAINDNYKRLIKKYQVVKKDGTVKNTQNLNATLNTINFKEGNNIQFTLDPVTSTLTVEVIQGAGSGLNAEFLNGRALSYFAVKSVQDEHIANKSNPHGTTAEQVGAYSFSQSNSIMEGHKNSGDHDHRYYTKTQLNNGQLDGRYYTKTELDQSMRDGDTLIKYEVFTIVSSNNGDGTFTYKDKNDIETLGELTSEGHQVFRLQDGFYYPNNNRIKAIINDTLHRSQVSGGLIEETETTVILTQPEGNGAEITFEYFERVGLTGEHSLSHADGGSDEVKGLLNISQTEPENKFAGKLWGRVL